MFEECNLDRHTSSIRVANNEDYPHRLCAQRSDDAAERIIYSQTIRILVLPQGPLPRASKLDCYHRRSSLLPGSFRGKIIPL